MPLVSVIIPVYNTEKYLNECIDSVLAQSFTDYEIIIVDDGSTDSSGKICDNYAKINNTITVIHKENGGQSTARNIGISVAKGKYLYFPDSDDYINNTLLEKTVGIAEQNNSEIVFFEADSFSDNNSCIKQTYHRNNSYECNSGINMFSLLSENKEFRVSIPLLLIRKDLLTSNCITLKEGVIYEDMLFTFQLFTIAHSVSHCHESLYYRRYRDNSTMTSLKSTYNLTSSIQIFKDLLLFMNNHHLNENQSVRDYITRNGLNVFNIYDELSPLEKKSNKDAIRNFSSFISENSQYINKELLLRTHGKEMWAAYKVIDKLKKWKN